MRKEMSRVFVFLLIGLFLFSSIGFAVGQDGVDLPTPKEAGEDVNLFGKGILDFMGAVLGIEGEGADNPLNILSYLFMGMVLLLFIYSIFETMDFFRGASKTYLNAAASFGVTMLAMIALPFEFFSVILPSYGAMGGAILTIIPFLMIFWFSIKVKSLTFARMTWFLFGIYYIGYYVAMAVGYYTAPADLAEAAGNATLAGLYLMIGIFGGVMALLMPLVRGWFLGGETKEFAEQVIRGSKITSASITALATEARAREEAAEESQT